MDGIKARLEVRSQLRDGELVPHQRLHLLYASTAIVVGRPESGLPSHARRFVVRETLHEPLSCLCVQVSVEHFVAAVFPAHMVTHYCLILEVVRTLNTSS